MFKFSVSGMPQKESGGKEGIEGIEGIVVVAASQPPKLSREDGASAQNEDVDIFNGCRQCRRPQNRKEPPGGFGPSGAE